MIDVRSSRAAIFARWVDCRWRQAVDSQDQQNKTRDKQIATNEAKREFFSDVRVSTWAVVVAIVICVIAVLLHLK
jgi:hypothetical protein